MSNLQLDLPTANTGAAFSEYHDHVTARSPAGRKIGHNTWAHAGIGERQVRQVRCIEFIYHRTAIATWYETGAVVLNSGGYRTSTTKDRLCRIGRRLGFSVRQRQFQWYLTDHATFTEQLFYDGITTLGHRRCAIGCECGAT